MSSIIIFYIILGLVADIVDVIIHFEGYEDYINKAYDNSISNRKLISRRTFLVVAHILLVLLWPVCLALSIRGFIDERIK